jgi:hypothetical protein
MIIIESQTEGIKFERPKDEFLISSQVHYNDTLLQCVQAI